MMYDDIWDEREPETTGGWGPLAPTRKTYAWWSDPDTDPPEWMLNQGRYPSDQRLPTGSYWDWMGDHWGMREGPSYQGETVTNPNGRGDDGPIPTTYFGGGGGGGSFGGSVSSMVPNAPGFNAPRYNSPGPFSWNKPAPFKAPDKNAIWGDPGFQARLELGQKAIENAASARGASRTGATWKGLIDYAENMGSQEYGQAYGRAASEYDRSYRNAFEDAVTTYSFLADERQREFSNALAASSAEYAPQLETWRAQNGRDEFGANLDLSRLGLVSQILQAIYQGGMPSYRPS